MANLTFHIYYSEYPHNNIHVDALVEIKDAFIYDKDDIDNIKAHLASLYDVSVRYVKTAEEIEQENKMFNRFRN